MVTRTVFVVLLVVFGLLEVPKLAARLPPLLSVTVYGLSCFAVEDRRATLTGQPKNGFFNGSR
jgi:hypothetical protein